MMKKLISLTIILTFILNNAGQACPADRRGYALRPIATKILSKYDPERDHRRKAYLHHVDTGASDKADWYATENRPRPIIFEVLPKDPKASFAGNQDAIEAFNRSHSGFRVEVRPKAKFREVSVAECLRVLDELHEEERLNSKDDRYRLEDVRIILDRFPVKRPFTEGVEAVPFYENQVSMLFGRNDKGVPLELTINTRMFEEKRTDLKEALRNAIRDHQAEPIESAMSVNEYTTKQDRARTTLATYPVGDREWADLFENRIWHMSSSHWRDKKETYIMDRQQVSKEERFVRWRVTERAGSYFNSLVEKRRAGELPKGKPIIVVELSADDCKHADLWMRIFKETEDEWAEEHGEELDFFKNMTFMLGEISGEIVKQAVTARDTPFLYEHRDKLKFIDAKVDFNKMGEVFLGLDIGPTERVSSGVFEQLCVLFESRQHPYLDRSTLERMNRTCLSVQSLIAHLVAMADAYDIDDDLRRALVSFDQTLFSFYQITEDRFFKALGIEDRDIRRLLGEASLGMINYAHNLTPAALISKRSGKIYKRMAKAYLAPSLNKDFIDDPANKDEFHSLGVREPEDIIELIEDEERYAKLSPELTLKIWEGVRIEYGCYEDDDPSAQLEEFLHSIEAEDVTMPMNVTFDLSVVAILWHMLLNNFGRLEIVDTIMEHTDEFTDRFWQLRKYGTSLAIWIDYLYFQRTGFDRFPPHGYQVATTTVPVRSIPGTSKDDNGTFLSFEWKPSQQLLELAKIVEGIVGTRLNPRQTISMVTMGHMDEALSGVSNSRSSNAGSGTESGDRERFSRSQPLIAEEVGENRFTLLTIDQAA